MAVGVSDLDDKHFEEAVLAGAVAVVNAVLESRAWNDSQSCSNAAHKYLRVAATLGHVALLQVLLSYTSAVDGCAFVRYCCAARRQLLSLLEPRNTRRGFWAEQGPPRTCLYVCRCAAEAPTSRIA